jgi:integrase
MANRPYQLDASTIATAPDGVHNDGGALDGCALEIHVRNGGKSKRAYFRYNGTPFGERRTQRIPLGPYDLGLPRLRRERDACEQLIEQRKSPRLHRSEQQERQRAATMTLRDAVEEFYDYGYRVLWKSPETRKLNERIKRLYLDPAAIMDEPLDSIRPHHLDQGIIGPYWNKQTGNSARMRSLLHGTFQYQIDNDKYSRPNPASWRKTAPLTRLLGAQAPSVPHRAPPVTDIPHLVAYLYGPQDHWVPGYLTTMQAAHAYECDRKKINYLKEAGAFQGVRKAPPHWKVYSNLIPISELKRVFGEFKRTPIPIERDHDRLYSDALLCLIFSGVRSGMICRLRWRNIVEKKIGGKKQKLLEYLPACNDQPSEHKMGWKFNVPYLVILTDNLHAIIEQQRDRQIRDGIKIDPNGFVFRHGRSRAGLDRWFGKVANHRAVEDHLTKAAQRIDAVEMKDPTPHGLRTTLTTWAMEHGYDSDLVNLTLGHNIRAISENKTNWSYFYEVSLIGRRMEMVTHWEQECRSLVRELQQAADNVISFHPTSSA